MTLLEDDMVTALIASGFATVKNTDIFIDNIMPYPSSQLMVKLTGGKPPITTTDGQTPLPGIQVYVVGTARDTVAAKAEAIRAYFALKKGVIRQAIWAARSSPVYLGQIPDDDRHKFVVEFQVFG